MRDTLVVIGAALIVIWLSGCSTVMTKGAQINDAAVTGALWELCYAASVGSIQRKFGQSAESADIYKSLCKGSADANVVGD